MKKLYPIGTVVLLKGANKRIMINGFLTIDGNDPNKVYDYNGVMYPEGCISSDQTLLFDHEQIDKVYWIGYSDQENVEFMQRLNEAWEEQKKKKK